MSLCGQMFLCLGGCFSLLVGVSFFGSVFLWVYVSLSGDGVFISIDEYCGDVDSGFVGVSILLSRNLELGDYMSTHL